MLMLMTNKLAREMILQDESWQEITGDVHTRATYNRRKLAAGGRPSKASVGDVFKHQTTVLQHIGKLHCKVMSTHRVSAVRADEQ